MFYIYNVFLVGSIWLGSKKKSNLVFIGVFLLFTLNVIIDFIGLYYQLTIYFLVVPLFHFPLFLYSFQWKVTFLGFIFSFSWLISTNTLFLGLEGLQYTYLTYYNLHSIIHSVIHKNTIVIHFYFSSLYLFCCYCHVFHMYCKPCTVLLFV